MTQEYKQLVKNEIKWLKKSIRIFGHIGSRTICYCSTGYGVFSPTEIAARYLIMKGYPLQLGYGTSNFSRDCCILIK